MSRTSYVVRNMGFMAQGGFGFMRQRREKQRASKNACAYVDASQEGCGGGMGGGFLPGVCGRGVSARESGLESGRESGGESEAIEEGSVQHAAGFDAHVRFSVPVSERVREDPSEPLRPSGGTFIDPATGLPVKTARI